MPLKKGIIIFALSIIIKGCTLSQDFNFETNENNIAVNGYLHPDSLIKVSITRASHFPNSSILFSTISNAVVQIYENEELIGILQFQDNVELYQLDAFPKEGNRYRLIVEVEGEPTLQANTSIPFDFESNACYDQLVSYNNKTEGKIELINSPRKDYYWLNVISKVFPYRPDEFWPDSSQTVLHLLGSTYSLSPHLDDFNTLSDGGLTQYRYYMRVEDSFGPELENYSIDIFSFETNYFFPYSTIQNLAPELGLYVNVYSASKEMDAYWKSSVLAYINSNSWDGGFNPFAEQVPIYTNIENGAGIFAGYNSKAIPLHLLPCQ